MGNKPDRNPKSPKSPKRDKRSKTGPTGKALPAPQDKRLKILVLGDCGVGKTSFIIRYTEGNFLSDTSGCTISGNADDSKSKQILFGPEKTKVRLEIWDTGGVEFYKIITSTFYQGANGVILMYDISNQDSFKGVQKWNVECERYAPHAARIVVGNKLDSTRHISPEQGEAWASDQGMPFMELSVKDPTKGGGGPDSLAKAFELMVETIMEEESQ